MRRARLSADSSERWDAQPWARTSRGASGASAGSRTTWLHSGDPPNAARAATALGGPGPTEPPSPSRAKAARGATGSSVLALTGRVGVEYGKHAAAEYRDT